MLTERNPEEVAQFYEDTVQSLDTPALIRLIEMLEGEKENSPWRQIAEAWEEQMASAYEDAISRFMAEPSDPVRDKEGCEFVEKEETIRRHFSQTWDGLMQTNRDLILQFARKVLKKRG